MIITRSPLRITLGGGGTDLPSYYDKNEGEERYLFRYIMCNHSEILFFLSV